MCCQQSQPNSFSEESSEIHSDELFHFKNTQNFQRGWLCLRFGGQRVEKETLLFKHWRLQGLLFLGGADEEREQSSPLCGSDGHTPAHSNLCSAHRDRCCRAPHWRTGQERNAQLFKNHQQLTSTFYSTNKVTNFNQIY